MLINLQSLEYEQKTNDKYIDVHKVIFSFSDPLDSKMRSIWIGSMITSFICLSLISAENARLTALERKILYSNLQNVDELKQFYEKLVPAASATVDNDSNQHLTTLILCTSVMHRSIFFLNR